MTRTVLSPNYSEGWPQGKPQAVFIHSTRSGRRWSHAEELSSTLNWFSNRSSNVSAHWVISPDEAVRVVADENRAWHAGDHNGYAYGIELTQPTADRAYEEGHYRLLAAVVEPYIRAGVPIVYVENFVNGNEGFTGHEDSAQGKRAGKSDPGPQFDWGRFLRILREEEEVSEQHKNQHKVAAWFTIAAGFATDGAPLPKWLSDKLKVLLAAS